MKEIDVTDSKLDELDQINFEFDTLLAKKFADKHLIAQTIRHILEKYGILMPLLDMSEDEYLFALEKDGVDELYLYIVIDEDEMGNWDAYAQIVDNDELDMLSDMDISDEKVETTYPSPFILRVRHSADD